MRRSERATGKDDSRHAVHLTRQAAAGMRLARLGRAVHQDSALRVLAARPHPTGVSGDAELPVFMGVKHAVRQDHIRPAAHCR